MSQQFFIKIAQSKRATGPITAAQLTRLAEEGKLRESHLVSLDSRTWCRANRIKGLKFKQEAQELELDELDFESAAEFEFKLEPLATPTRPPTRASDSHRLSHAAGGLHSSLMLAPTSTAPASIRVPNPREASLLGLCIGLSLMIINFLWFFIVMAAGDGEVPGVLGVLFLVGWVVSIALIFVLPASSFTTVSLTSAGNGNVNCVVRWFFLYLPRRTAKTVVTKSDQLTLKVCSVAASEGEGKVMQLVTLLLCFLVGILPGLIFYVYWYHFRTHDTNSAIVRLILYTKHYQGRPIVLFTRKVKDYYGTRLGAPAEADKIKNMFQKMVLIPVITDEA